MKYPTFKIIIMLIVGLGFCASLGYFSGALLWGGIELLLAEGVTLSTMLIPTSLVLLVIAVYMVEAVLNITLMKSGDLEA